MSDIPTARPENKEPISIFRLLSGFANFLENDTVAKRIHEEAKRTSMSQEQLIRTLAVRLEELGGPDYILNYRE